MSDSLAGKLVSFKWFPDLNTFNVPDFNKPIPAWPFSFQNEFLKETIYPLSLNGYTPIIIATVYFCSVHLINGKIQQRQIDHFKKTNPKEPLPKNLKKLKAVPFAISKTRLFKVFVLLHNIFLCLYSVWTFIGMTSTIHHLSNQIIPLFFSEIKPSPLSKFESFWQSICNSNDEKYNLWMNISDPKLKGLTFWAYLFYLSKYYEILDTVIILLNGKPSSLLQSYHHSGAILCMWSGTRYMSPPIWIFVVFNSFIHSLMYFYFSLSCINIRLPKWFKQTLTSLQITQFVVGGSLALVHLFVRYYNNVTGTFQSCISNPEEAMAVYVNVVYLTPLTLLFGAFYVDSYRKKSTSSAKKNN